MVQLLAVKKRMRRIANAVSGVFDMLRWMFRQRKLASSKTALTAHRHG